MSLKPGGGKSFTILQSSSRRIWSSFLQGAFGVEFSVDDIQKHYYRLDWRDLDSRWVWFTGCSSVTFGLIRVDGEVDFIKLTS